MIRHIFLCFLTVVAFVLANNDVSQAQGNGEPVIVVFHAQASFESFRGVYRADERARLNPEAWDYLDGDVAGAVQALEATLQFRADHIYSAALRGFAARLTAPQISALENHPLVAYVEPDVIMTAKVQELPWGIDRIDADAEFNPGRKWERCDFECQCLYHRYWHRHYARRSERCGPCEAAAFPPLTQ